MSICGFSKFAVAGILGVVAILSGASAADDEDQERFIRLLELHRATHGLRALAAAVILDGDVHVTAAVGYQDRDSRIPVTDHQPFNLGPGAEIITGALAGMLVENRVVRWNLRLEEAFPELIPAMHPAFHRVTLDHLLSHRSGLAHVRKREDEPAIELSGNSTQQRYASLRKILAAAPETRPGEKTVHTGLNHLVAAALIERMANQSWESLIRRQVFLPMRMNASAFSPSVSPESGGRDGAQLMEILDRTGPGIVYGSIGDWTRFVRSCLTAVRGGRGIYRPASLSRVRNPPLGGDSALGWSILDPDWADGPAYRNAGYSADGFTIAWMAPGRNAALIVIIDAARPELDRVGDDLIWRLAQIYFSSFGPWPGRPYAFQSPHLRRADRRLL